MCRHPVRHDSPAALARCAHVTDHIRRALTAYNAEQPGASMRIGRVLLMVDPPSIDAGEVTDKGYINQRCALERRSALVERLYGEPPDSDVMVIE